MAARHEETVDKKVERMLARFILTDNRDKNLAMPDILAGTATDYISIISAYPLWAAAKGVPPIARRIMKGKARGIELNGSDMPLLPGFEGLNLGYRFAVPPRKVVEDGKIEPIDEESNRTVWHPRHTITVGNYGRHVGAYQAQGVALQREIDLRVEVLEEARRLGGADDEVLIAVLARGG